jgi:hypothetical protein
MVAVLWLAACGGDQGSGSGGTAGSGGASTTSDTGAAGSGGTTTSSNTGATGGSGGGTGGVGGSGGGSMCPPTSGVSGVGGAVADCEAELDRLALQCNDEVICDRACFWDTYKEFCTTGEPEAITASAKCFPDSICWTFADSNTTQSCLDDSFAAHPKPKADELRAAMCELCVDANGCDQSYASYLPPEHLPDAALDELIACVQTKATCLDAVHCVDDVFPELVACF